MEFGGVATSSSAGLEAVRALHQTVVALRAALEQSKNEILELKEKAWPIDTVQDAIRALSIENHVLRQRLIESNLELPASVQKSVKDENTETDVENSDERNEFLQTSGATEKTELEEIDTREHLKTPETTRCESVVKNGNIDVQLKEKLQTPQKHKKVTIISPKLSPKKTKGSIETRILIKAKSVSPRNISRSLESLTVLKSPLSTSKRFHFSKNISFSNLNKVSRDICFKFDDKTMSGTEQNSNNLDGKREDSVEDDEEAQSPQDDIDQDQEVDDIELIFTTDDTKDSDFKEQLVSIEAGDSNADNSHTLQLPLSEFDQLDVSDRELDDDVFNDNFENENQENTNLQSFEKRKENSQIFNSKSDNSINQEERSLKSYYSYQDSSFENKSLEKDESFDRFEERVRIVETDISKCGIHEVEYIGNRRNTCPNPIQYRPLMHREAMSKGLSARQTRPILTHSNAVRKESGAQTDISALPGSSWRSESSLANKTRMGENFTTLPSKTPLPGSRLKLSEKTVEARRVLLSDIGFTSMVPELSRSADHLCPGNLKPPTVTTYGQFLRTTDLYSPGCTNYQSQKFTWTTTTATPSEGSQTHSRYSSVYPLSSPPAPSRRCSAPVSPSRRAAMIRTVPSKVRFANGSLPELRTNWSTIDSGDSTDSLVEEAENYLRRSIDCIIGREVASSYGISDPSCGRHHQRPPIHRRSSAPEPACDNVPPPGWMPFLPRAPRDLRPDHWVKVITAEGRVRGGRVRYVGVVHGQAEPHVGVQLATPEGSSDGVFNGRRYFQCEPFHGIFVPFRKVIMGWRP